MEIGGRTPTVDIWQIRRLNCLQSLYSHVIRSLQSYCPMECLEWAGCPSVEKQRLSQDCHCTVLTRHNELFFFGNLCAMCLLLLPDTSIHLYVFRCQLSFYPTTSSLVCWCIIHRLFSDGQFISIAVLLTTET